MVWEFGKFLPGVAGAAGGAIDNVGVAHAGLNFGPLSGGAGGGGCTSTNRAGGAITMAGPYNNLAAGTAGGGAGNPGYDIRPGTRGLLPQSHWFFTGGSGGGSFNTRNWRCPVVTALLAVVAVVVVLA
jgi:hypothetical protein